MGRFIYANGLCFPNFYTLILKFNLDEAFKNILKRKAVYRSSQEIALSPKIDGF